ncbi:hypothetical protein FOIG_16715 [Fusarium odoratissimum NRRL 54006]|uniref:Uncharacterized protein n=1 Tax=Fusarium odoratissimum (strain NRRL 54006) TaxID=1089451 RepID=X0J0V2_FUSO5|nr:uncharacterized protein FOIG_16715 [Fusarium odoratissimum NRRL 54006]EXL90006.1 hypothetical protein FOIG_16715 [Fusarium odoratissimum NRRL 54006]
MRLPDDGQEYCQCPPEECTREGECNSSESMLCGECMLPFEPVNTTPAEHAIANTAALPSEIVVYSALSRYRKKLKKAGAELLAGEGIERFIGSKKHLLGIKEVVKEYGASAMCVVARILIQKQVFELPIGERRRRFPELFTKLPLPTEDDLSNQNTGESGLEDISGGLCRIEADQEHSDGPVEKVSNQDEGRHGHTKLKVWHKNASYPVPLEAKVQHRLMVKLQQVMEHACYEFAQREMQKTLEDQEWDHPEAVELNQWMNILIGHDGFDTNKSTEELEALFLSGVEIRDVAVKRVVVDPWRTRVFLKNAEDILKVPEAGDCLPVVKKLRGDVEKSLGELHLTTMFERVRVEKELAEIAAESKKLQQRRERVKAAIVPYMKQCQEVAGSSVLEAVCAAEVVAEV